MWWALCCLEASPLRRSIINELLKQVAKAALLTIVPILIQAFADRYLSEEEPWANEGSDDDQQSD